MIHLDSYSIVYVCVYYLVADRGKKRMTDLLSYFISKRTKQQHNDFYELVLLLMDSDVNTDDRRLLIRIAHH